jgi:PleD family two-component response regulator
MTDTARHIRTPVVLIINDQEWSTRSLESILSPNGYAVMRAYTGVKGLERAATTHPDVIVVGAVLPDMDSLELCRELRSAGVSDSTPIILTSTAKPGRAERLEGLRAGAWDYLGQPLDSEELLLRFDAFVRAKHDADRARQEGLIDAVTGFYSVAGLARRARELGSLAYRQGSPLACLVFGPTPEVHQEDALNSKVVATLIDVLHKYGRVADAIGRVGEAEFALFAQGANEAGAATLAQRVTKALHATLENGRAPLLVGYYAVPDFRRAGLLPHDMLERATRALNQSRRTAPPTGQALH